MLQKTSKQIFDFLPGLWKITREIVSNSFDKNIIADGCGLFSLKENLNIILYSEKVNICNIDINNTYIAKQKYKYKYDINTSSISKYFNNDKFFYIIKILDNQIYGEHLCVKDQYVSHYTFFDNDFILTYYIQGPFKNYKIITKYSKTDNTDILGITICDGEIV